MRKKDILIGLAYGLCAGVVGFLVVGTLAISLQHKEQQEPVVEVYEPQVWKGRVECVYGNSMVYSVDNLVDFIVTAQPAGWMWEMFREDGTVIFYQQPSRTFCSAVPEE